MGRLLLVDDDPVMILDQVTHALGPQGIRIEVARTGEEGVRQVGQVHVEQDDVRGPGRDLAEPFPGGARDLDLNALGAQGVGHLIQNHHRIVIDQQHSSHTDRSPGQRTRAPG